MKTLFKCFAFSLLVSFASGQIIADSAYRFQNPNPAFKSGDGPLIYLDSAHFNAHTAEGTYKPFARLLIDDGYKVHAVTTTFSQEILKPCRIIVIANAQAETDVKDRSYPHSSAFSRDEINALFTWIHGGGSLLLIADHVPFAGAVSDLATILGVQFIDGFVGPNAGLTTGNIVYGTVNKKMWQEFAVGAKVPFEQLQRFLADPGKLGAHPIIRGRSDQERISAVVSFAGSAFYPSAKIEPLLILGPRAAGLISYRWNSPDSKPEEQPLFPVGGWLQGAAVRLGQGRAVILSEAGMCTALAVGPDKIQVGMNSSFAPQNAQFCLNMIHWLSGLLD
jgi:hypothetical protein